MQEKAVIIDVSLFEKVFRTIVSIGILVAAFLLAMDTVNAENMANNIKSAVDEYLDEYFVDLEVRNSTIRETIYNECSYVIIYPLSMEGQQYYFADFYYDANMTINQRTYNNYFYVSGYNIGSGYIYTPNRPNQPFSSTGNCYRIISDRNKSVQRIIKFNVTNSVPSTTSYTDVYVLPSGSTNLYSNMSGAFSSNSIGTPYLVYANKNGFNNAAYTYRYFENTIEPIYNSTVGFNVFKYNNLGTDTLRIVPPQNQVPVGTHSSNMSTVSFDLVIDGTTIPCEYNSESEYYFESLEYARAYYEIPLSVLLPSSLNDFDEVYVTNVNYVNTWSNQGGESGTNTFVYVDKCYLKRSIGNDDVGQVIITHVDTNTGYTDTEINNINTMISNASTLQGSFDVEKNLSGGSTTPFSFSSFQDAVVREIECWHPTGTKTSDWVSITIDGVTYDSGDNMYWLEYDSNSTQSFDKRYNYNVSPYSYVRENNYSGYYDIIYFIVHEMVYDSSGTGISTLDQSYTRYYYFISDRYYNKLILYREMDILTYIKLNNEIGEKTYNYLFDRLLNIDDNLYYYIKDKAVIDNDILEALEDIDNDMQFNLDIVVDLLNKILNAILELDIEPTDTTAIENKLDDIYTRLGNSNLNSDWYKRYREWLYDETNDNVLNTPHEYMLNTFDDVKALFDVFAYFDLPQTGFWSSAREYLNRMNGNTYNDNINDYLVTGISSQNFYKDNCNTLVWSDIE